MKLVDKFQNEYRAGSMVTEHNKVNGRTRDGWQIFRIIERAGSAAIGIRRPCPHLEKDNKCREEWCPKSIRKWVAPSSIGLKAVRSEVSENA